MKLGQGNIFIGMCQDFCSRRGWSGPGRVSNFWGVSKFWGCLQFFGGLQIFGGVSPIFQGVSPNFRGCLQFFKGSPNFQGGCLQIFGGSPNFFFFFFYFFSPKKILLGSTPPPETVNARPVRILLECILVWFNFKVQFCLCHCVFIRMSTWTTKL